MTDLNVNQFSRHFVGASSLLDYLNSVSAVPNYPPYNVIELSDDEYEIEMAVSGFTLDEIVVEEDKNTLRISAEVNDKDNRNYMHRGIARRSFRREWRLVEYVKVQSATMSNGILSVRLKREVPEDARPRRITIGV